MSEDILLRCTGRECERKQKCWRYRAPWEACRVWENHRGPDCLHFLPITQEQAAELFNGEQTC